YIYAGGRRSALAAEAARPADEERRLSGEQQALVIFHDAFGADHRRLALVPHLADAASDAHLTLRWNLAVQGDGLLAGEQHGQIDLDVRHQTAHREHAGNDGVGRQYPRPLPFVDELQFALRLGTDTNGVQHDVLRVPGERNRFKRQANQITRNRFSHVAKL